MAKSQTQTVQTSWLQNNAIRLTRIHFYVAAIYAVFIVATDAWHIVIAEFTWHRWEMFGVLLTVTAIVSYLARGTTRNASYYRLLIIALILVDIALATFTVYTERGMASRGVMLYALPIVSSALLLNRSAIFGTASLCTAAYVLACTRYFYVYFNEGYRAELYTTLGFYSAGFFVLAAVLWIALTPEKSYK